MTASKQGVVDPAPQWAAQSVIFQHRQRRGGSQSILLSCKYYERHDRSTSFMRD